MTALSRAVSLLRSGETAAARAVLLADAGESAQRDFLLGACAHALQDIPGAIAAFTDALRRDAAHAPAACALGSLFAGLGRPHDAVALFRKTLLQVEDDQLRFNLAVALEDTGQDEAALAEYGTVLARTPGHYGARHNRAGVLARLQRLKEAAADYRFLVDNAPQETLPWHNLGEIELALGNYEAATRRLETVLQREPRNGKALLSLAVALAANGDIAASRTRFAALREVEPARWEDARARLNNVRGQDADIDPRLLFLIRQQEHLQACNWRHWTLFGEIFRDLARAPGDGDALALAYLAMHAPMSAAEQLALTRRIAAQVSRHAPPPYAHTPRPAPARLRVGYAATRFGHHVTGLLFRHFFASHDTGAVEVHLLSLGPDDGSANIATIRATPELVWHDLSQVDDREAAARIHALGLDVLVDLAVYNDMPRPEVLAAHPAPVQVGWQGAAYSSGAAWQDYVIADAVVRPGDGWCSEAEVLLPGCYFTCSTEGVPPAPPPRTRLGLPEDKFVFACLNVASKLEPGIFDIWMRILARCPDSVLWLLGSGGSAQVFNLKREAEWRGIDPRRLLFASRVLPEAHIARQGAADLFLDTGYYNGHTTIAESLWAGTPALTCPGETFASRVGASLVTSCDLPELVMATWEDYEATAVSLYQQREQLQQLRTRLAATRLEAPSFKLRTQAAALEKAYRHMRERFAQGLPPASFHVAELDARVSPPSA
ncbi:MAG: repeat-containing protein [Moraxellaceae bacterium]|nr:repeat-containing protein [Moraxellaceae bacterium]